MRNAKWTSLIAGLTVDCEVDNGMMRIGDFVLHRVVYDPFRVSGNRPDVYVGLGEVTINGSELSGPFTGLLPCRRAGRP